MITASNVASKVSSTYFLTDCKRNISKFSVPLEVFCFARDS